MLMATLISCWWRKVVRDIRLIQRIHWFDGQSFVFPEAPGLPLDVFVVAGSATGFLQLLYKLFGATRVYTGQQP